MYIAILASRLCVGIEQLSPKMAVEEPTKLFLGHLHGDLGLPALIVWLDMIFEDDAAAGPENVYFLPSRRTDGCSSAILRFRKQHS